MRDEIPELPLSADNVRGKCPEGRASAIPIPVRHTETADRTPFRPDYGQLMASLAADAEGASVRVVRASYPRVYFVSDQPEFAGKRAVHIVTRERKVDGRPGYIAVLPLALVSDLLLLPVYAFMALTGIPHGQ